MNKGQLRTHFKALLNRSDCGDDLADTFIDQSIGRIQRTIRIPSMERQQAYNFSSSLPQDRIVLPADFLEIIDIYYDNSPLSRLPIRVLIDMRRGTEAGPPKNFAREQDSLLLYPRTQYGTLFLNYYGQFDPLIEDADVNAITEVAADAVSYGALAYASDYFLDERGGLFEQKFGAFLGELQSQANDAESSGTVQAIIPSSYYQD